MLLLVLLIAAAIISTIWDEKTSYDVSLVAIVSIITTIVSCVALFILIINFIIAPGTTAKLQQEYIDLTYQVENYDTLYANSAAYDKKQLHDDVREWNSELMENKTMKHNIWVGAFYPADYDNIELIELN